MEVVNGEAGIPTLVWLAVNSALFSVHLHQSEQLKLQQGEGRSAEKVLGGQ